MQAAARFVVLGLALIEQHPVAGFQRILFRPHDHVPRPRMDFLDAPDEHAAMPRIEPMHQLLVIGALQETVREAARKAVPQLFFVALREDGAVESAPILVDDVRDVLGPLHAPFDLEATHARGEQLGQQIVRREIFRAEQVLHLIGLAAAPVDDQVVRQTAALRALPPVGAAVLQRLAGQALPAPAHAQRAVDEALELQIRPFCKFGNFADRKLARQDYARDAERGGDRCRLRRRHRHLRRRVQRQLRTDGARQPGRAEVLHDDRVRPRPRDVGERRFGHPELAIEDEGVESDESLHALRVQKIEQFREVSRGEVIRPGPRIEAATQAEIDCIRARRHGGPQALLVPRGGEQLGFFQQPGHEGGTAV